MKRALAALGAIVAVALPSLCASHPAEAQASATVSLMHGIPGTPVDVVVGGAVVASNFQPGTMQDISKFAGQTLTDVEVRAAGTSDVVIGPVATLAVPSSGNWTILAHLDAGGKPTITPFENDTSAVAAGQGRLIVRHTAAAPAVDIVLADGSRPITNLSNPNEAAAVVPAGTIAGAKIAPTGGDPIADVPTVEVGAGSDLIVYAIGSLDAKTFTFATQTIADLGGAPSMVSTGDSLPAGGQPIVPTLLALGASVTAAAGGAVLVARRARGRHAA